MNLPDEALLTRLQGLANLAAKNSSPEEAAVAMSKLQELLTRHNLDFEVVENAQAIKDGKREEAKVDGGSYKFQRQLWKSVAELNFVYYWTQSYEEFTNAKRVGTGRARYTTQGFVVKKRHGLIGKIVNVRATIAMAQYLEQAIEQALVTRLRERGFEGVEHTQRFSNWAVSYKKGAARRIREKLEDRARALEEKILAEQRDAVARAERAGVSTATTVAIADLRQTERAANIDFRFGDGTSARWAAERAARAAQEKKADEEYAAWALANPLLAAAEAAKARRTRVTRGSKARDDVDRGAYWSGYDEAADIGLDQQMDGARVAGLLR